MLLTERNSTLNSDAIQASVNSLFSILKIAKFLTQCNKQERILAYNAIRRKLIYRSLSNFAYMLQVNWIRNRAMRLMQFTKFRNWFNGQLTRLTLSWLLGYDSENY